MSASWREASSGMLTLTNVGEPPPPYTAEVEDQGQQGQLTSVPWEPPPMYDVAIVPKPYEVSLEEQRKSVAHTGFPFGGVPTLLKIRLVLPKFLKIFMKLKKIWSLLKAPPRVRHQECEFSNNDCKYFVISFGKLGIPLMLSCLPLVSKLGELSGY